jgi:hypothetical protein
MKLWLLLVGIVIIVLGLFGGALLSYIMVQTYDPIKDPVAKVTSSGPVELKKGDYEIWEDEDAMATYLKITDPDGNEVETESPDMAPIQKGHNCNFLFTAEKSGTYTFDVYEGTELYVVEPKITITYTLQGGPCCAGIVLAIIGILIAIIGLILKKKKT